MTTPDAPPPANQGEEVDVRFTIRKSEWGWTAYLDGRMVAHSTDKALLRAYLKECG